jgi:hypothetical protein
MSHLVWSPVHQVLEDRIKGGDSLILVLVPFVKLAALQQLHWVHSGQVKFKVICRWRPEDLLSGVSDLQVFHYLKNCGCQLFINSDIHLKLYVFESHTAFNTSGNLTLRGLGYSESANIEVGNMVSLSLHDWTKIYQIINSSRQVDDALYQRLKDFVEQNPRTSSLQVPADLIPQPKVYTISALPATESPKWLSNFYFDQNPGRSTSEEVRRAAHDLATFEIPQGLTQKDFDKQLGTGFCRTPFVQDFVDLLRSEKSLRFGAVNDWIHRKCEDVPLPYRWEIKDNTRIFYDWLVHYNPNITWDRPNYSQVIYWNSKLII